MRKLKFKKSGLVVVLVFAGAILIAPTIAPSLTDSIVIQNKTTAAKVNVAIGANDLKPAECNSLDLKTVVNDENGISTGTADNDLVLGSSGTSELDGNGGDDCILSSSTQPSTIDGGPGADICIGNANTTFVSCESEIRRS